jgi:hypothetical protein
MSGREEYFIPRIARDDYVAFQHLINTGLPATYDEWLTLMEQARLENERKQIIVRAIEITSQEFVRYCWAKRCAYSIRRSKISSSGKRRATDTNSAHSSVAIALPRAIRPLKARAGSERFNDGRRAGLPSAIDCTGRPPNTTPVFRRLWRSKPLMPTVE